MIVSDLDVDYPEFYKILIEQCPQILDKAAIYFYCIRLVVFYSFSFYFCYKSYHGNSFLFNLLGTFLIDVLHARHGRWIRTQHFEDIAAQIVIQPGVFP